MKSKVETYRKFVEWKNLVEKQTEKKLKTLRTDNGLEFLSNEFKLLYEWEGIQRHLTVKGTSQQNGFGRKNELQITKEDKMTHVKCSLYQRIFGVKHWRQQHILLIKFLPQQ